MVSSSRTAPIPNGAERKRGDRACIPCREAKAKCFKENYNSKGSFNSPFMNPWKIPCSRCVRLEIKCEYAPNKRIGRPRRLPVPRNKDDDDKVAQAGGGGQEASTSTIIQKMEGDARAQKDMWPSEWTPSSMMTQNCPRTSLQPQPQLPRPPSQRISARPVLGYFPSPSCQVSPLDTFFPVLLNEYSKNVHPQFSILPSNPPSKLEASIRSAPPTLLFAILHITFPNTNVTSDNPDNSNSDSADDIPLPSAINPLVLSDIQAAILLCVVYYGRCDKERARIVLDMASKALLNTLPYRFGVGTGLMATTSMSGEDGAKTASSSVNGSEEDWKRILWRCWGLEILLSVVTGYHSMRLDDYMSLFPNKVPSHNDPSLDIGEKLTIQSFSFLRECIRIPQADTPEAIDKERIRTMTSIGFNLFTLTRQQWLETFHSSPQTYSQSQSQSQHQPFPAHSYLPNPPTSLQTITTREQLLLAAISSATSTIHLHITTYASCLFECGIDMFAVPRRESLEDVRKVSRQVFDLVKDAVEADRELARVEGKLIGGNGSGGGEESVRQRSPFFACSQFVVAHGAFLAATSADIKSTPGSLLQPTTTIDQSSFTSALFIETNASVPGNNGIFAGPDLSYTPTISPPFTSSSNTIYPNLNSNPKDSTNTHPQPHSITSSSSYVEDISLASLATDFQMIAKTIALVNGKWPVSKSLVDDLLSLAGKVQERIISPSMKRIASGL